MGWTWSGDPAETNEFGFRGHRTLGRVDDTVMLLGDSQVESRQSFGHMPEVFLGAALRDLTRRDVRVVSVGSYGWGQDQQLLALRHDLAAIQPRLVLLWFTPDNDLWNNTFPTHMPKDGGPSLPSGWRATPYVDRTPRGERRIVPPVCACFASSGRSCIGPCT